MSETTMTKDDLVKAIRSYKSQILGAKTTLESLKSQRASIFKLLSREHCENFTLVGRPRKFPACKMTNDPCDLKHCPLLKARTPGLMLTKKTHRSQFTRG